VLHSPKAAPGKDRSFARSCHDVPPSSSFDQKRPLAHLPERPHRACIFIVIGPCGWQPDGQARLAAADPGENGHVVSLFATLSLSFAGRGGYLTTSLELKLLHDGAANTLVSVGLTVMLPDLR